jgi:hypothetical protein
MLPTLVDHFDTVAFRIEDVSGVVSWVVVKAGARLAIGCGRRSNGGRIEGIDLRLIPGDDTDLDCPRIGVALPQPEEHPAVATEAFQIRVPLRAIRSVVVDSMENAEWRQSLFVKAIDRSRSRTETKTRSSMVSIFIVLGPSRPQEYEPTTVRAESRPVEVARQLVQDSREAALRPPEQAETACLPVSKASRFTSSAAGTRSKPGRLAYQ